VSRDPADVPRRFYADRVNDREVAELLGLCKGMIADGVVNEDEAIALKVWLRSHPDVAVAFPGKQLAERLDRIFADGVIQDDERAELETMVADLVGEPEDRSGEMNRSTRLPLTDPAPAIFFEGKEFVFTGNFCMRRKECERLVTERAGRAWNDVTRRADYLVIGTVAADAWITAAWGNKILSAMQLRDEGHHIAIVAESHWLEAIELGA
jgi:NAD-dependent DNA ligase